MTGAKKHPSNTGEIGVFSPQSGWVSQTREAAALVACLSSKQAEASGLKIWADTWPQQKAKPCRQKKASRLIPVLS